MISFIYDMIQIELERMAINLSIHDGAGPYLLLAQISLRLRDFLVVRFHRSFVFHLQTPR